MKYKVLGTTLSFKYEAPEKSKSCTILATYKQCKHDMKKYNLAIKLFKRINDRTFEHLIDRQEIPAEYWSIKDRAARIVEYGVTSGGFDRHFEEFAAKINKYLN